MPPSFDSSLAQVLPSRSESAAIALKLAPAKVPVAQTELYELGGTSSNGDSEACENFKDAITALSPSQPDFSHRSDRTDYFDPNHMPAKATIAISATNSTTTTSTSTNGFKGAESSSSLSSLSRSASLTTNSSADAPAIAREREKTLTINTASAISASASSPHSPSSHSFLPLSNSSFDVHEDADGTLMSGSPASTIRVSRPAHPAHSVSSPDFSALSPHSPSLRSVDRGSTKASKRSNIAVPAAGPKTVSRNPSLSQSEPNQAAQTGHTATLGKLNGTRSHSVVSNSAHSNHNLAITTATTSTTDEDEERDWFSSTSPVLVGQTGVSATGFRGPVSMTRQRTLPANTAELEEHLGESSDEVRRMREEIIAKRESKKRRKEVVEDDKVLVGTKVGEDHVNYILAYNMLTGIRVAVSRTTAKVDRELTDNDFTARHKLAFDISGNELTPSAKYDFKFKDYAPWVFRHLRQLFRLDPADYLISLTSKYIVSELGSPGKSGSFFYFSRDYRFIIKTIHHSEHKFLLKVLKEYYNHVKANPNTLISQFYGLHRVKLPYGRKIHFIIMNNLFPPHRDIHQTFDLKGSTIGRDYDESKLAQNRHATMKDLNWLRREKHISLGPRKRAQFTRQLEIDVHLLERLNIMDYSLLIGIHDLRKGNTENIRDSTLTMFAPDHHMLERTPSRMERDRRVNLRRALSSANPSSHEQVIDVLRSDEYPGRKSFIFYADDGGLRATDERDVPLNEIYYLGVIDCLTNYSLVKKLEGFVKGLTHSRDKLSAVPPVEYGERFYKFIKSAIKTPEQLEAVTRPDGSASYTAAEITEMIS